MRKGISGFTVVELLIVIVIIAILAAITIVAYNGIQARAAESGIKADMQNAGKKLELLKVDVGTYPAQTDVGLGAAGIKISPSLYDTTINNFLYCGATTSTSYAFVARAKNGTVYAYGSNHSFGVYTANPISDYAAVCLDLANTNGARYGYVSGWRTWTGAQ